MRISPTWLAGVAILALAAPALADWPAGGKLVLCNPQSSRGIGYARLLEAPSGDLMLVSVGIGVNGSGWSVGRITRDGDLAAGWGYGIDLGVTGLSVLGAGFAADDSGGFWIGRNVSPGQARHVLPGGGAEPQPGPDWSLSMGGLSAIDAATATGSSDVYFADMSDRVKRFTRAGGVAPGWPATGRRLFPTVTAVSYPKPAILPDGSGGAVLYCLTAEGPRAGRVDAGSALHAGWPAGGVVLGPSTSDFYLPPVWPIEPLVPSGPGHFIAIWCDFADGSTTVLRVVMQRFALDGTLDPAWPAAGLQVAAPDSIDDVTLVADGQGGAYVLWERSQRPFGTHVLSDGSFAGGLTDAGVSLLPAGAPYVPLPSFTSSLVADHGLDGGLVFVWSEPLDPVQPTVAMRVRWLQADLTPEPAEPAAGLLVIDDSIHFSDGIQRAALADGSGGVFLAWNSILAGPCIEGRLAMTHVSRPSFAGVPPASGTSVFALGGAMPNPARGSVTLRCTLPGERAARLELYDVNGRRWRSAAVSGAGEHVLRFGDLDGLPAGLYLARLALGAETRTSRFVKLP